MESMTGGGGVVGIFPCANLPCAWGAQACDRHPETGIVHGCLRQTMQTTSVSSWPFRAADRSRETRNTLAFFCLSPSDNALFGKGRSTGKSKSAGGGPHESPCPGMGLLTLLFFQGCADACYSLGRTWGHTSPHAGDNGIKRVRCGAHTIRH